MCGSQSRVTTAPAATTAPSPIVTPGSTVARAPIQTPSPTTMGFVSMAPARLPGPPIRCVLVTNVVCIAIAQSRPMAMGAKVSNIEP